MALLKLLRERAIRNKLMRDIEPAFQQFREGVPEQPELAQQEALINLPGSAPINLPAQAARPGIQPGDLANLQQNLIGIGTPESIALAGQVSPKSAGTPFAKINPKDFTQSSVNEFQRTRDFSKLVTAKDPSGTGNPTFNRASNLRGEFTKSSGEFVKVRDSFARIQSSAEDPSAAGDLSLIFNYMKMLDPGSVVRESEFATAANSAGVPDRIRKQYNNILRGERLAPNTRADFVDRATRLWGRQELQHEQRKKTFTNLSVRAGVDPKDVVINVGLAEAPVKEEKAPELKLSELTDEELLKEINK